MNTYQPVHQFQVIDAATGLRANRSFAGKAKDNARNLISSAEVSHFLPHFSISIPKLGQCVGLWHTFLSTLNNY